MLYEVITKIPHEGNDGFEHAVDNMSEVIRRFSPDEIYCPHPADGHPDHIAARNNFV